MGIVNPESRIGVTVRMHNGMLCTCIAYRTGRDCDFRFDNGDIVEHKRWGNFVRGQIESPMYREHKMPDKYIGQYKIMPSGEVATILEYHDPLHIIVGFEDGTFKKTSVRQWKNNHFAKNESDRVRRRSRRKYENIEKYVGMSVVQKNGLPCTLIEYQDSTHVVCEYPDGLTKKVTLGAFKKGEVPYSVHGLMIRKKQEHEGEHSISHTGYAMTLVKYHDAFNSDVMFDDGVVVHNISYGHFKEGEVEHPNHKARSHTSINELCLLYYLQNYGFKKKKFNKEPVKGAELDLYNESLDIAIEYDGVLYHAKKCNRDEEKYERCKAAGIRLFRIREEGLPICHADDYMIRKIITFDSRIDETFNKLFDSLRKIADFKNIPVSNVVRDKEKISTFIKENYHTHYVGQVAIMNNGQKAEIIAATGSDDCTVRFEDGTVLSGKTYGSFQRGSIGNPNYSYRDQYKKKLEDEWVGKEINVPKGNTTAKVLSIDVYWPDVEHSAKRVYFTIQYANGICERVSERIIRKGAFVPEYYKAEHQRLQAEKEKIKRHKRNLANKQQNSIAHKVAYWSKKGFDVTTEDGYALAIAAGKAGAAEKCHEKTRKKYLGQEGMTNSGHKMKIIEVQDYHNVTIMFDEDPDKIKTNVSISGFKKGRVRSPFDDIDKGRLHFRKLSQCGEWMEVVEYFGTNDMTVKFDSGETVYHRTWANFINGKIGKKSRNSKRSAKVM